jgi:hypothetical protein
MLSEIVAGVLVVALLTVVTAMAYVGLLGIFGSVRYVHCAQCSGWTFVSASAAEGVSCFHCRHPLHVHRPAPFRDRGHSHAGAHHA